MIDVSLYFFFLWTWPQEPFSAHDNIIYQVGAKQEKGSGRESVVLERVENQYKESCE